MTNSINDFTSQKYTKSISPGGDFSLATYREFILALTMEYEVVLIDATETPIERPKKELKTRSVSRIATTSKKGIIQEKREDTP